MAVSFTHLSWWLWSGKHNQEPRISPPQSSSLNSTAPEPATWDSDALRFPLVRRAPARAKRKLHSRRERKKIIDREYDVVIVPSDGVCVSGSESDDSDWSIGWLEPHGPGFHDDEDSSASAAATADNSFAVIVPCYGRRGLEEMVVVDDANNNIFTGVGLISDLYSAESKRNMEEWLSSLQKSLY